MLKNVRHKIYLILFVLGLSLSSMQELQAQNDTTNAFNVMKLDLSLGLGPSYGLSGAKFLIGNKYIGAFAGVGLYKDFLAYTYGAQFSYEYIFISFGRGHYGIYEIQNFPGGEVVQEGLLEGWNATFGIKYNFLESKRLFVEAYMGVGWDAELPNEDQLQITTDRDNFFGFGVGYVLY